jgi:acylphosphatase
VETVCKTSDRNTEDYQVGGSSGVERRHVVYQGHVQGVGFRFTTLSIARRYAVTGYVCNLPDGRVELVAEGDNRELDQFVADVATAMSGYIRDVKLDRRAATGEFGDFGVR